MPFATIALSPLRIALGEGEAGGFDAGVPVLAGDSVESLFGATRPAGRVGALTLFQSDDWLLGAATVPLTGGLEQASRQLYADIFEATAGRHLARIWNYVPAINAPGADGLENYRVFCRGRSLAFEERFGTAFNAHLPSASAVGSQSDALTIAFAASRAHLRHVENPLQVAAYDYPAKYGPRPPSFARATVVTGADQATAFISGTAAILGHATLATDNVHEQLECALKNLSQISLACRLGPDLGRNGASARHFKVYLRHASDHPSVAATLERRLLKSTDRVSYLLADLCRAPLLVEIEASLFGLTEFAD